MIVTDKRTINMADTTRAITSVTVSRTSSLREPSRPELKEDPSGTLVANKRSLSNDKMSSDSMVPVSIYQRGSSLRQNGKTTFPISSPHSNNHHAFKIIKPIETSPRASESSVDHETPSSAKVSSQRLKFKHRGQVPSPGGPLIPDHNLMKEAPRDNVFTPRPPLVKRYSSEQEEVNSDNDTGQPLKNTRSYQIMGPLTAPRPPISPTRGIIHTSSIVNNDHTCESSCKPSGHIDDDTSEMEDVPNSDCESPPPPANDRVQVTKDPKQRSSLRKGSESPNQTDLLGRGSPSPTKTVKWNLDADVKKIPRSRSLNGKLKAYQSRPYKSGAVSIAKTSIEDQKLVESHEVYISHCTTLMRHHMSSLENLRRDRISISHYKKDLADLLECQKKLLTNLENILAGVVLDESKDSPKS